jgi:hypothetical protein
MERIDEIARLIHSKLINILGERNRQFEYIKRIKRNLVNEEKFIQCEKSFRSDGFGELAICFRGTSADDPIVNDFYYATFYAKPSLVVFARLKNFNETFLGNHSNKVTSGPLLPLFVISSPPIDVPRTGGVFRTKFEDIKN